MSEFSMSCKEQENNRYINIVQGRRARIFSKMNSISIWRLSPGIINVVDPRLPDLYVRIATECQRRAITPQSLRVLEQILPREVEKSKHLEDFCRLEVAQAFLTFWLVNEGNF